MMELFMRIFNKVFRCYKLYSLKIDETSLELCTLKIEDNFEIKILNVKDIHHFEPIEQHRKGYKNIATKRLADEDYIGLGLFDKHTKQLVYFNWIKKQKHFIYEVNTHLNFNAEEALLLDDYTLPAYRGRGLHSHMMNERLKYCLENGIDKVYILIICFNLKAIRTIKKYGIEIEKSFFSLRIMSNDKNC